MKGYLIGTGKGADMDGLNEWIFPSTRIADAVRFRPASLGIFYAIGLNPWEHGDETISDFCSRIGKSPGSIVKALAALEVPRSGSDWESLPVHHLIDFLTVQHREFLHSDLPSLRSLLEMPFREASGGRLFQMLLEGFHHFREQLAAHIQSEEEEIFPAILRNEYALKSGAPETATRPTADHLLASARLIAQEDDIAFALEQWTKIPAPGELHNRPKVAELAAQVMQQLEQKLLVHGRLERESLYPIACRLEKELASVPVP